MYVGIQVSCSAEDHSAVRDGRFPVSKYSRTSLYIAGHLPHLDTSSNQASNQATFPSYPSYLLIGYEPGSQGIFIDKAFILVDVHSLSLSRSTPNYGRNAASYPNVAIPNVAVQVKRVRKISLVICVDQACHVTKG